MADISLLNILADKLHDWIFEEMTTDVTDEETELGLVKVGKLQDDPTVFLKNVLIREGDETTPHILHKDGYNEIFTGTTYSIGGLYSAYWWRRYRLRFELFFLENDRSSARRKAWVILSRMHRTINTMRMPIFDSITGEILPDASTVTATSIDSFGEMPHLVVVKESSVREAGGTGTFIWRGEMAVEFLTSIENE